MSQPYLLSKFLDPAFALAMGATAAVLRIRRDETEANRDPRLDTLLETGRRRYRHYFGMDKKSTGG